MEDWVAGNGIPIVSIEDPATVEAMTLRSLPHLIVIENGDTDEGSLGLCRRLKSDRVGLRPSCESRPDRRHRAK